MFLKRCDFLIIFIIFQGLKRHLLLCQPEPEDDDLDDPLAFEICHCCGEPIDTAHKVVMAKKINKQPNNFSFLE